MHLTGVALFGNPSTVHFHEAWMHFGAIADEIGLSRSGKNLYGLQLYPPTFPPLFAFTYLASIEIIPGVEAPIRMLTKTIPRCTCVIQKVIGGVDGIDDSLQYLYKEYIPSQGLKVAMPFDVEKYCNVKNSDGVGDDIEVWNPIAA